MSETTTVGRVKGWGEDVVKLFFGLVLAFFPFEYAYNPREYDVMDGDDIGLIAFIGGNLMLYVLLGFGLYEVYGAEPLIGFSVLTGVVFVTVLGIISRFILAYRDAILNGLLPLVVTLMVWVEILTTGVEAYQYVKPFLNPYLEFIVVIGSIVFSLVLFGVMMMYVFKVTAQMGRTLFVFIHKKEPPNAITQSHGFSMMSDKDWKSNS